MSSEKPPTDSQKEESPSKNKRGERKPDRPSSNNVLWYLIIGGVVVAAMMVWMSNNKRGNELSFGEFQAGLKLDKWNKENVYNLKIARDKEITFQDQPVTDSDGTESTEQELPAEAQSAKRYYISIYGMDGEVQKELTSTLTDKGIDYKFKEGPSEWYQIAYLLLIPLMFVLFFIILFRRMGGAGSAMSFGRSRGRMYATEEMEVTFDDVAGIDEA
ncbi:MAG: cell division protein FtsH, partial [Planctomycetaceae bacterium]|nr:cell division protein FtsH [Planctomycetaceae bacterium]